ncbi:hypothetical protein [Arenimonas sp. MALMAid1274]|uniref:hypothetical protein n=1 Tax=Arenimonas sp. MALMAid1274 TaxID=3411630 RepID=UPI003BA1EB76
MKTIVLLAGLLAASGAWAAEVSEAPGNRFLHRYDRNGDGRIDAEEYRNFTARLFARRDRNGDGVISADEHGVADGGDISRDDFIAQSDAAFASHDSNGDGYMDLAEIVAARKAREAAKAGDA